MQQATVGSCGWQAATVGWALTAENQSEFRNILRRCRISVVVISRLWISDDAVGRVVYSGRL